MKNVWARRLAILIRARPNTHFGTGAEEMTDDDPNEAYEVVPIEPGPNGPPKGWWTVK